MNNPLISILIPVFNQGELVLETLNSVRKQTYKNWECIIVDDGSTDSTPEIIKNDIDGDSRFRFFERSRLPKGGSVCRNIALSYARGEYVMFLDSDDLITLECLEGRINKARANPDFDLWVFRTGIFYHKIGDNPKVLLPEEGVSPIYLFLRHAKPLPWTIMGPLWKRTVLESLGGFDEKYPRLQDPELHTRALLQGFKVQINNEIIDNYYRQPIKTKKQPKSLEKQFNKAKIALTGAGYYYEDVLSLSKGREDSLSIKKELNRMYSHFFKLYHQHIYELKDLYLEQLYLLYKKGELPYFKYLIYKAALKSRFITKTKGIAGIFWRLY